MPLKNWCSIYARWSKSSLKHVIRFCDTFSNLKQNFIAKIIYKIFFIFYTYNNFSILNWTIPILNWTIPILNWTTPILNWKRDRHDWVGKSIHGELWKKLKFHPTTKWYMKFHPTTKWYMHKPESVSDRETRKILWDFDWSPILGQMIRPSDSQQQQKREPA